MAANPHFHNHCRGKCMADSFAPGKNARVRLAPAAVLVVSGNYVIMLCDFDTVGQDLVYSQVWRLIPMAGRMYSLIKKSKYGIPER